MDLKKEILRAHVKWRHSEDIITSKLFPLHLLVKLQLIKLCHTASHFSVKHIQSASESLQVWKLHLTFMSLMMHTFSLIFLIAPQDPSWTMLLSDPYVFIQPAPSAFPPLPPLLTHWCFSFHQLHHAGRSHGTQTWVFSLSLKEGASEFAVRGYLLHCSLYSLSRGIFF